MKKKSTTKNLKPKPITAEEFDRKFDAGEDLTPYLNLESTKMVYPDIQRVNIDIPQAILKKIDAEANRMGMTRTSLIKYWLAERTDKLAG